MQIAAAHPAALQYATSASRVNGSDHSFTAVHDSVQLSGAPAVAASDPKPQYVPGQVLIKTSRPLSDADTQALQRDFGFRIIKKFDVPDSIFQSFGGHLYQLKVSHGTTVEEALSQLQSQENVLYAEPNYVMHHDAVEPNDLDPKLWGLKNTGQTGGTAGADISATQAWDTNVGKNQAEGGPLVAVIDTGIDYNHPDLAANTWTNPGEVAGDGQDNDGNGFVDDVHGYDFVNKDGDPFDDHSHGTHCMGTIAAVGNNGAGVVGVNWKANVMGLKFLSGSGSGSTADAIEAVLYASKMGVKVTSNSWGGGGFSKALNDAFKASPALHICAAGNSATDTDRSPHYPSSYDLPNIVSVAASTDKEQLASFSNYGRRSVDLAAPGERIYSTIPNNGYANKSGTSMATPHVSGAAALILSQHPDLNAEQLKSRLLYSTDKAPAYEGKTVSGGRLNVAKSLEVDVTPPDTPSNLRPVETSGEAIRLAWTATGDDGQDGQASAYELRMARVPIVDGQAAPGQISWEDATPVATLDQPQSPGSEELFEVNVLPSDKDERYFFALRAIDNVGNRSGMMTSSGVSRAVPMAFREDLEGGNLDQWTVSGSWGLQDVGGNKVLADSPDGVYGDNADSAVTSRVIDLSGLRSPRLSFRAEYELENRYDFCHVEITQDNGATWTALDSITGAATWERRSYDLSAFEGKQVQVRFRLTSDSSIGMEGISIDDLTVTGAPPEDGGEPAPEPPPEQPQP